MTAAPRQCAETLLEAAEKISTRGNSATDSSTFAEGANTNRGATTIQTHLNTHPTRLINSTTTTTTTTYSYHTPTALDAELWKRRYQKQPNSNNLEPPNCNNLNTNKLQQQISTDEATELSRWQVPRIGSLPEERSGETFRFMGAQLNGMCSRAVRDRKLQQISNIIDRWEIQAVCAQEVGINWSMLPLRNR